MIELKVYNEDLTESTFLDLFKDEPINYSMSFAEIQDITKKNSGFSKPFTLPGTKKNNIFFNHFYNPSSASLSFDARFKRDAEIMYNGYLLSSGYIRLMSSSNKDGDITYKIVYYDEMGNLLASMGDKKLKDLTTDGSTGFVRLDHTTNLNNIKQSWNADSGSGTGLNDGSILYPLLNRGYVYNRINDNYFINTEITPLFSLTGIAGSGIFGDNNEKVSRQNGVTSGYFAIRPEYYSPSVRLTDLFELILNDNGFSLESNFLDTNEFVRSIYLPTTYSSGNYGLVQIPNETSAAVEDEFTLSGSQGSLHIFNYDTLLQDEYNRWQNTTTLTIPLDGVYTFEFTFDVENNGSGQRDFQIQQLDPNGQIYNVFISSITIAGNSEASFVVERSLNLDLNQTPNFEFQIQTSNSGGSLDFSNFKVRQTTSPRWANNSIVKMNEQLGDTLSQTDVISSVLKMFNLVLIPKPNDEKVLIVEPMQSWVGQGEVIDWTTKVNRDKAITITDTTKFINSEIKMSPVEGKDLFSTNFKDSNKLTFGQRETPLNQDFKQSKVEVKTDFSIPQSELLFPSFDYTLPVFYKVTQENSGEGSNASVNVNFQTTPSLVFWCGKRNINLDRGILMNYDYSTFVTDASKYFPQSHHLTYFPVNTFSQNKTIGFNRNQYQGDYKQIEVNYDLYNLFYETNIDDFLSVDSRFMSCELYLTNNDLKKLDFSERILIDGTQWRVNKLSNINLAKAGLVKAELLSIGPDFLPVYEGTDAIILTRCDGLNFLYTTIALNANYVQYAGKIVKVGADCYYVNPPSAYDPNQTYTQIPGVNIDSYTSCSECGQPGIFCEPIINKSPNYGTPPQNAISLGLWNREDQGDQGFPECEVIEYFWDCNTNEFYEQGFTGFGSCQYPDGWNFEYGTPITIPPPINATGYLVEQECFDPQTGFNYDIYWQKDPANPQYPDPKLHKICSANQPTPTTTTTTTLSPPLTGAIRFENCLNDFQFDVQVDPNQPSLFVGEVVKGQVCFWNTQTQEFTCYNDICSEVIGPATDPNTLNTMGTSIVYPSCSSCQTAGNPTDFLGRRCDNTFQTKVIRQGNDPLSIGDVVTISGSGNVGVCYTIESLSNLPFEAVATQKYDNCNTCEDDNDNGGGSSSAP